MKKQQTSLQKSYQKEVNRINNIVNKLENQGYKLNQDISLLNAKPTKYNLERLKGYTTEDIKIKSYKVDKETGEVKTYRDQLDQKYQERRRKKEEALRKRDWENYFDKFKDRESNRNESEPFFESDIPSFSSIVIANFRIEMNQFPKLCGPMMNQWLDKLLTMYDQDDIAEMLEAGRQNGDFPTYREAYDSYALGQCMTQMLEYLPEMSQGFKDEINEQIETGELFEGFYE
jgi:hypothetical protein